MSSETWSSSTLGARLRAERLRQGWSLAEVESKTRIGERFLRLIEEDRVEEIPGIFFAKSFLRQYSALLGLHDESVEGMIADRWGGVSEALPGETGPDVTQLLSGSLSGTHSNRQRAWIPVLLVIAAVALGSFLFSQWQSWSENRAKEPAIESPAAPESSEPGVSESRRPPRQLPPAQSR